VVYTQREWKEGTMVEWFPRIGLVLLLTAAPMLAGCAQTTTSGADVSPSMAGGAMAGATPGGSTDGSRAAMTQGALSRPNPKEFVEMAELRDIHFDFDRYDIRSEDAQVLDANAESLKSNPSYMLLIEGHTDPRGTTEYNLALGDRRARASMNYLVARGVRSSRIVIISYGKEHPSCTDSSETCWSQNRRAHFLVKGQ
jgi:peptidoglycan-associated lipoprotein